jgi:hypothetical protein
MTLSGKRVLHLNHVQQEQCEMARDEKFIFKVAAGAVIYLVTSTVTGVCAQGLTSGSNSVPVAPEYKIELSKASCSNVNFGALECGEIYEANFDPIKKAWKVRGKIKGTGSFQTDTRTVKDFDTVSIWGIEFKKRNNDLLYQNVVVGTITPWKR